MGRPFLIIIVFWLLLLSCNQPFEPKGEFHKQLVVFSILSTDRDTQVVRLSTNYDPPALNPYEITQEQLVSDAVVTITDGNSLFSLKQSPLPRPDTSRYRTPFQAYVVPLTPEYGKLYSLLVRSPEFDSVYAVIRLPGKPSLSLPGSFILEHPEKFPRKDEEITFDALVATGVMGILVRFYIDYEITTPAGTEQKHFEVPFLFHDPDYTIERASYPTLFRYSSGRFRHVYPNGGYISVLKKIIALHPNTRITFTRAVFLLLQAEQNFYKYYKIANGFEDTGSIRLDQPNYSNIVNGLGVFGGYTLDSLAHSLPDDFSYNIR